MWTMVCRLISIDAMALAPMAIVAAASRSECVSRRGTRSLKHLASQGVRNVVNGLPPDIDRRHGVGTDGNRDGCVARSEFGAMRRRRMVGSHRQGVPPLRGRATATRV